MNVRHVYLTDSMEVAERCVTAARVAGLPDDQIALVASDDVAMNELSDDLKQTSATDFIPATMRGAVGGGAAGLVAGLVAASIPSFGITLAGAGLVALVGTAVGTWSSAMVGASIPNEVHRKFEEQIENGGVLVVLDAAEERMAVIDDLMRQQGASRFDYEVASALT